MMTLYHSPMSRSTRLVQLVYELGANDAVTIETVGVTRADGTGGPDPRNPHPEGKVPMLVHDGVHIWESTAIAQYLAEQFPDSGLHVPQGDPRRGPYLSWLAWYGDVLEPLIVFKLLEIDHPDLPRTFRSLAEVTDRLTKALEAAPYLCGERYTVADLIVASTFNWQPSLTPDVPAIQDWAARCQDRPAGKRAWAEDAKVMAAA